MVNRRQFLQFSMAALALSASGCALSPRQPDTRKLYLFSAADNAGGEHTVAGVSLDGQRQMILPVADRCHGGCSRPRSNQVLLFARRPGRHFYVVDTRNGTLAASIPAGDDHHYYGHGVFSPDGRYLYTTENHYPSGQGLIGVYDADDGYRRVRRFSAGGIGPHELRLHPDGDTLVVALGGIKTHPDYQRIKLNLDTMAPALLLIDRHSGEELKRYEPSHPQLSCRHLDVSPDGIVVAGYQYQGAKWQTPPLIARLDTRNGEFSELNLDPDLQDQLANYTASVAVHPTLPVTAITAPRGGKVLLLNHETGELIRHFDIGDCAGAMPADQDGFLVTSGMGGVYRVHPASATADKVADFALHWDNHLTPVMLNG